MVKVALQVNGDTKSSCVSGCLQHCFSCRIVDSVLLYASVALQHLFGKLGRQRAFAALRRPTAMQARFETSIT